MPPGCKMETKKWGKKKQKKNKEENGVKRREKMRRRERQREGERERERERERNTHREKERGGLSSLTHTSKIQRPQLPALARLPQLPLEFLNIALLYACMIHARSNVLVKVAVGTGLGAPWHVHVEGERRGTGYRSGLVGE